MVQNNSKPFEQNGSSFSVPIVTASLLLIAWMTEKSTLSKDKSDDKVETQDVSSDEQVVAPE